MTNYRQDLDGYAGFLREHPADLLKIFRDSEQAAIASSGYWQDIRDVKRTSPFEVNIWAGFPASWDAWVWYRTSNTVRYKANYAYWNFMYSGRACPDNHDLYLLNKDGTAQEFFCVLKPGKADKEQNRGKPLSCNGTNPIHGVTGNKFQRELIYQMPGNSHLKLEIFYNSHDPKERYTSTYSRLLSSTIARILQNPEEVRNVPQSRFLSISVKRDDGRIYRFSNTFDWDALTTVDTQWKTRPGIVEQLETLNDPQTGVIVGLQLTTEDGSKELYSTAGKLIQIEDNKAAIGTVCSVTINGIFLNEGIHVTSRFGGLLELINGVPLRFTEVINYDGSSIDPLEIFIKGGMTDVQQVVQTGNGRIGASFREFPCVALPKVESIKKKLDKIGLGGILMIGRPGRPLLEIPVSEGRVGMIVSGGLNPVAAVEEVGIITENTAMKTLFEFDQLIPYWEVKV